MKIKSYLTQSPIFALYRAQNLIILRFQKKLKKHQVHLIQGLILTSMFFEDRDVRPLELQNVLRVEKSNLSHALRGLEKKKLIKRSMHPKDARGYLFQLTSSGKSTALDLIKDFDFIQNTFEEKLGQKKSVEIIQAINDLTEIVK